MFFMYFLGGQKKYKYFKAKIFSCPPRTNGPFFLGGRIYGFTVYTIQGLETGKLSIWHKTKMSVYAILLIKPFFFLVFQNVIEELKISRKQHIFLFPGLDSANCLFIFLFSCRVKKKDVLKLLECQFFLVEKKPELNMNQFNSLN